MSSSNKMPYARQKCDTILRLDGGEWIRAQEARTFFSRLRGLHAFLPLDEDEALIITSCNAVHTFTMPYPIDVVFVDSAGVVLNLKTLVPRRWCAVPGAVAAIEMNEGLIDRAGLKVGSMITRDSGEWG